MPFVILLLGDGGRRWPSWEPPPVWPRHTNMRLALTCSVLVVFVTGCGDQGGTEQAAVSAAPPSAQAAVAPLPADLSALVVRDGDRVTGTGWVNKQPDGTVVLCNSSSIPQNMGSAVGLPNATPGPPGPIRPCPAGVPLEGADLGALLKPDVRPDGSVEGTVSVTGTYSAGKLVVETQEPAPVQRGLLPNAVVTPCSAPPEGWPEDGDVVLSEERLRERIELDPLTRDPRVVTLAISRPFPGTAVLVVLARDASTQASLQAELSAKAPRRVCVVVSRFTLTQQETVASKLWDAYPDSTRDLTPNRGHAESSTLAGGSEKIRSWPARTTPTSSVVRPSTCSSPPPARP